MLDRYQRAQTLMQGFFTHNIVPNSTVYPVWIEGADCFWYEREIQVGEELSKWGKGYRLVDAQAVTNTPAFDHDMLATALAEAAGESVDKSHLPIKNVQMTMVPSATVVSEVAFTAFDRSWVFEPQSSAIKSTDVEVISKDRLISPDGKQVLFSRDYNLWVQDLATGQERALTRDGEEFYCYAVVGNGWGHNMGSGLQARWSPDSSQVFTVQRDTRRVKTLPVVEHVPKDGSVRPKVRHAKVAMQGDDNIPEYRLLAIDVESEKIQAANYRQIPIVRNSWGFFYSGLGWWGNDSRRAYFVELERDYKTIRVVEFDTHTGSTRVLFEETSSTHISTSLNIDDLPTFVSLPESNELIWFSERSGWAHCYLYDLESGELKNTITQGDWLVRDILSFDANRRELYLQTTGRVLDRDPYYRDLVRVNVDSGELVTLASGDYDLVTVPSIHPDQNTRFAVDLKRCGESTCGVSPRGDFSVITRSRVDSVPVSVLLNRSGEEILEIETADMSPLHMSVSKTWQWPEPVKLLAADGKTDIYGVVYRPSDFSPDRSYPVVSHVFNTAELTWVPKGSFTNGPVIGWPYMDAAALAELGFIVVQIDGRGTPFRSKAFYDESYGWSSSASNLEDHVTGIQQLAKRYPYMDLNRVGIYSVPGGPGIQGLLDYPDFYKVGACAITHDSRLFSYMWGDKFEGLAGPGPKYRHPEANVENLQGKLLLIHGMLDVSAPPAITFRLVEALQKANKDFDLLLLPNVPHAISSYMVRRAWDYLVTHLQGAEPPKEFNLSTALDV